MKNSYRLSTSEAGLEQGFLYALGVFSPTNTYRAYSTKIGKSTGGETRQGYKNDTWQWINLTPTQLHHVIDIVETALTGGGIIYATLPRANGENGGLDWVDVSAQVSYPDITPMQGGANGYMLQSVTLRLNNIAIINDPSTVV